VPGSQVRFDDDFLQIFMILGCFEPPILRTFGTNRCSPIARQRVGGTTYENGYPGHAGMGLWDP